MVYAQDILIYSSYVFLKLFQYLLVVLTFLILKGPITFSVLELLQLFITDTLYTVLLQFLILFVAILFFF